MAYITNNDKMLEAVLSDPNLMKFGDYSLSEITSVYQALYSDNIVINTVAHIIKSSADGMSEREIYKEVTEYLKKNV